MNIVNVIVPSSSRPLSSPQRNTNIEVDIEKREKGGRGTSIIIRINDIYVLEILFYSDNYS